MTIRRCVLVVLELAVAASVSRAEVSLSLRPLDLTRPPSVEELAAAGQLGGPLHPTRDAADTARERRIRLDFGRAIQTWNDHDYRRAVGLFRRHLEKFPDSPWAAEAELHLGCDAQYQGRYQEARSVYTGLIERHKAAAHPGARMMAHKARLRLGGLEVLQYDFAAAGEHFRILKAESPDWRHRTYAAHWIQRLSLYRANEAALLTCGTQALAHVLESRGQGLTARALRAEIPASPRGRTVDDLVRLARRHGQVLQARRLAVADLPSVPLPAIVHLEGSPSGKSGHYWVVEGADARAVRLFDPQSGRRFAQTTEEFAKEWRGVAVIASDRDDLPGTPMEPRAASEIAGGCCGAPMRESNLGATGTGSGSGPGTGNCAPAWDVNMINMNFYAVDTPLWFAPAYGPPVNITLSYNSQSAIAYHEPFGAKWQFNYATYLVVDTGGTVTVFMPDGRRDTYTPDGAGGFVPPYQVRDNLVVVGTERYELRRPDGTTHAYSMPRPAGGGTVTQLFLEAIRDPRGLSLSFNYDAEGRLVSIVDAPGRLTTLTYDASNRVTRVADPFGRSADFEYDADGNLVRITDMGGYASTLTYDADRYLTGIAGARGPWQFRTEPSDGISKWSDAYPPPGEPMWANYRITVTNPAGDAYEYFYYGGCEEQFGCGGYSWFVSPRDYIPWRTTSVNNLASQTPRTRYVPTVTAGGAGAIARILTPEGRGTLFSYDADGNVAQVLDPAGHATSYTYGARGQVLSKTDPSGATTTFTYAPNQVDVVAIIDGLGATSIAYNAAREVASVTNRLGHTVTFAYNAFGQVASLTDRDGATSTFSYGTGPEPELVVRAGAAVLRRTHDARGRITTFTDASGLTLSYAYDDLDRITSITWPDALSRTFEYAACCVDRLESVTERSGQRTRFAYDALSRLTEVLHPDGSATRYGYDRNGNRTRWTDRAGRTTSYTYDLDDLPVGRTAADGTSEAYGRDGDGLVALVTNARGQVTSYLRGPSHRVTAIDFDDATPDVTYAYDAYGRLVTRQDGIGTTRYAYDAESRRTQVDGPWDADTVTMDYDASGRPTRIAVEGGASTTYTHDAHGRVERVTNGGDEFAFAYTGASPFPASLTRPSGVTTSWNYDSLGRIVEVAHRDGSSALLSRYTYAYDAEGRRTGATIEDGLSSGLRSPRLTTSQFNAVDELSSSQDPARSYVYDADGNPTASYAGGGAPMQATYDPENHLTSAEFIDAGGHLRRSEYTYDGDGWLARVVERSDGVVSRDRRFVRGARLVLQERNAANAVVSEYAWDSRSAGGIGGLLQRRAAGAEHAYLFDAMGNVTGVTDATQGLAATYRYDPFGEIEAESGALAQDFRFATKVFEPGLGRSHFGFRFYEPGTGRWTTRDPIREAGGTNLYGYVDNDPLNRVDPWGLATGAGDGAGDGAGAGAASDCDPPPTPPAGGCGGGGRRPHTPHGWKHRIGKAWMFFSCVFGLTPGDTLGEGDTPNATAGVRG